MEAQVAFDELDFAFALDGDGLLIEGRARESAIVLVAGQHSLASRPTCEPVPLAGVLRAIAEPDSPLVPVGSAVPWVADLLPANATRR